MTEALVIAERVRNAIALGESHFREFKSAFDQRPGDHKPRRVSHICRDIGEALVAFANGDGGDLLVGVEDDGAVTGIPHSADDISVMLAAPSTHVYRKRTPPLQIATELALDGKTVLLFSVAKGTRGVYQLPDGRCVRRSGVETVPESVDQILFDQRETRSRTFDSEYVDGADVTELDLDLVTGLSTRFLTGLTPEKYLQQLGLAEYAAGGLRLRRAALLLFARDIARWHPRSQVRILKVEGQTLKAGTEYNVSNDEYVQGNLLQLLDSAWEALRSYLVYRTELGSDTRFEQRYTYPEWACREALVNAIAHRDYSLQASIDVFVYDDHMEVRSPGSLLSTVTIDQLERLTGAHESRNSLVARVLREAGFVRELGEGMKRIFTLMQDNDLQRPDLATDESSFTVTLYSRSVFSRAQQAWLEEFASYNLTQLQQRIVVAGMEERDLSPRDIYAAMATDDRDTYDREVSGLRNAGILSETRTNAAALSKSRRTGQAKAEIPRFRVVHPGSSSQKRVAVFNLSQEVTTDQLAALFGRFGDVVEVSEPVPARRGSTSMLSFVQFRSGAEAVAASKADGLDLGGRSLRVELARPTHPR